MRLGYCCRKKKTIPIRLSLRLKDSGSASSNFIAWVQECASDYTTGISTIATEPMHGDAIYDLQGRRVNKPTKGIFIHNGKKVVIK